MEQIFAHGIYDNFYVNFRLSDGSLISIKENFGAWLNCPDASKQSESGLRCNEANCIVKAFNRDLSDQVRLYVQAIKDVPRTYELLQNYGVTWWMPDDK